MGAQPNRTDMRIPDHNWMKRNFAIPGLFYRNFCFVKHDWNVNLVSVAFEGLEAVEEGGLFRGYIK